MNSIELFTGAGGLALGTHQAGFRHRGLVEWDEDACDTLRKNASAKAVPGIEHWRIHHTDVRLLPFDMFGNGDIDLVAGGAPCQPFSLGGKHRAQDDSRNMFPEFARAVRELQPRAFILENVKGLLRTSFSDYFEYIKLQLTYPTVTKKHAEDWTEHRARLEKVHTRGRFPGVHYNVVSQLLNAANYGVPQLRERVFIVGFRADTGLEWSFPEPTHSEDALLWDKYITGAYWKRHGLRQRSSEKGVALSGVRMRDLEDGEPIKTKPWVTIRDAIADMPTPRADRESKEFSNHRLMPGAKVYPGHTGSPIDMPSKTLKAGVHGVPGGENMIAFEDGSVRYLTVREAARVQSFPDAWHFEGAWSEVMRQLGNAVPVGLAEVVAKSVAAKLEGAGAAPAHSETSFTRDD
ncbi:DNA cytosine methyltransferase [Pyxidicoccus parkwayensis]|uniref:DNA (cytosine-5-)-methyltransferase n=1 Tax=Pyxidicoccus parkwayensis TaxID=2813578 RepID=A0ABX7NMA5_9BACT|nr:DNA cytosine methyltransferase [Pyxidicoccus parkwaysis]QSQ19566.1 DNA cytosine methyltransferase [Pyxidicoccus parkwaysis]